MSRVQKSHGLFLGLCILFAALSQPAFASRAGERDVETETTVTSLPQSVPSPMYARSCGECSSIELKVTKDTRFFAGTDAVDLETLREIASKRHFMMVFYDVETRAVTRIVIHGVSVTKSRDRKVAR